MSYLSLYRRRRPLTFADMTGQEHITRTLGNVLISGRPSHAYLFCGPRGTGKTTAAKIFARALNCALFPVSEPCGACPSCENIAAGVSLDVIEMDAASNRGIEEIRELRERSRYASGESRFKIYILDEAHMLTPEACNAFLKTLEEPPPNVVFILATTDPSKLPSTIISRCQRFDFHLLTDEQICARLVEIVDREKWEADRDALKIIALLADGSLRDALGIMEQCYAYGGEKITADQVRAVTGATNAETVKALVHAALNGDINAGMDVIQEVVYNGRDLNLFLRDLMSSISRLLQDLPAPSDRQNETGKEVAPKARATRGALLDAVELLHGAGMELKGSYLPRYVMEVTFLRLIRVLDGSLESEPQEGQSPQIVELEPSALTNDPGAGKVSDTKVKASSPAAGESEEKMSDLISPPVREVKNSAAHNEAALKSGPGQACDDSDPAAGLGNRIQRLKNAWPGLVAEVKKKQRSTASWLEPAAPLECRGNNIIIGYTEEYSLHRERIMENSHRTLTEKFLSDFAGEKVHVKSVLVEEHHESIPEDAALTKETAPEKAAPKKKERAPGLADGMEIFEGDLFD